MVSRDAVSRATHENLTPIEVLQVVARATGRTVEQVRAELDVQAAEPSQSHAAAKDRERVRAELRAPAKPAPASKRRGKRKGKGAPLFVTSLAAQERRARFAAESERRGCPKFRPKDLAPSSYALTRRVAGTRSAETELRRFPPAYRRLVMLAAYAMERTTDGRFEATRSLAKRRARRVIAAAALMLYLADRTKRNGHALVVEGYVRGTLALAFRENDDTEEAISVGSLFNTQDDGERDGPWQCGALEALKRAGAIRFHQPPADTQPACNVGRDRDGTPRAINQYWITEAALTFPEALWERLLPAPLRAPARTAEPVEHPERPP